MGTVVALLVTSLTACTTKVYVTEVTNITITQLVGPDGGTVELQGVGKVVIPAGALTEEVPIKITKLELNDVAAVPSNLTAAGTPVAFEPHGTQFSLPVTIEVPFDGDGAEVRPVKLPRESSSTSEWTTVFPSEKVGGKLSLETTSFSVILAARPRRGTGVVTLPDGAIVEDAGTPDAGGMGGTGGTAGAGGAGGTGPCGDSDALERGDGGERSCRLALNGSVTTPGECSGTVTINSIPLGCNDANGWRLTDPRHIELLGTACVEFIYNTASVVFARFPCDVFTPGGSGGTGGTAGAGGVGGTGGLDAGDDVDGGHSGSGGVSGSAGTGGVGGDAGVDGGNGGFGGTGGAAGTGTGCGSGPDIRTGAQCEQEASGWFAVRTLLDAWWQGVDARDPGRGMIELHHLVRVQDICPDGTAGFASARTCGVRLPPFTSDVTCDAFQYEFADAAWESPVMPRYLSTAAVTAFAPGGLLSIEPTSRLIGVDLLSVADPWPSPLQTATFPCLAGSGASCFPDHDYNGLPGLSGVLRSDGATYAYAHVDEGGVAYAVTDTNYGRCTQGSDYRYRGIHTNLNVAAGGGVGGGVRASTVHVGIRMTVGNSAAITGDCSRGVGAATSQHFDIRAIGCEVDPSTLIPADGPGVSRDPRLDSMQFACTATEATFVDEHLPMLRILSANEVPGSSARPNGWHFAGREIDKRPSRGPRTQLVRLASPSSPEPSCADVRTAPFPFDP